MHAQRWGREGIGEARVKKRVEELTEMTLGVSRLVQCLIVRTPTLLKRA